VKSDLVIARLLLRTFRDKGVVGIAFVKAGLSLMREAERVAKALQRRAVLRRDEFT